MNVRPARVQDAPGIARVHVDSWRATYPGIVPDIVLARLNYGDRERWWHNILSNPENTSVVFVAVDDAGKIIGFASGGSTQEPVSGYDAELYAIYLYGDAQGQGLGRRLVHSIAQTLADRGYKSMVVWVLADNPARGFYEWLGGTYVTEKEIMIGGEKPLQEVAYGWPDVRALTGHTSGGEQD
jgi:GNAT superfamily N-acetyltransferase